MCSKLGIAAVLCAAALWSAVPARATVSATGGAAGGNPSGTYHPSDTISVMENASAYASVDLLATSGARSAARVGSAPASPAAPGGNGQGDSGPVLTLHAVGLCVDVTQPTDPWDAKVLEYALGQLGDRMRIAWLRDASVKGCHLCPNPTFVGGAPGGCLTSTVAGRTTPGAARVPAGGSPCYRQFPTKTNGAQ